MTQIPFPIYLMIPSGILIFTIGLYSWIKTRKKESFIFLLLSIVQAMWSIGTFKMWQSCGNDQAVIFWDKLLYLAAIFMPALIYHFSLKFCRIKKQKVLLYLSYFIAIFFAVLTRTDYFVKDVFYYKWGCHSVAQTGQYFFILYIAFFVFLSLYNFFKVWSNKKEDRLRRNQSFYIFWAVFVFGLTGFELLPAYRIGIYPAFYLSLPIFAVIFAYAITQKQLFPRVLGTNILVATILIFLFSFVIIPEIHIGFLGKFIVFLLIAFPLFMLLRYTNREIKLREEAEDLAKEIKRLDEAKTQFMMATQHHLRTPLTAMIGYLDLIFDGTYGKVSPRIKQTLLKFQASAERLNKIVNELLDVSQFQLGKKVVSFQPNVNIESILKDISEDLKFEVQTKKIYLKFQNLTNLPKIKADPEKLRLALSNIIDNAVKYTLKGGVVVNTETTDSKILISVKDTGIGISREKQKNLFHRIFERGKRAKKANTTGKGIGLYITYHIIKAHYGRVWVESEGKGKGTTFYVELPINQNQTS